jgi:Glycosyltransferase family 87
MIFQQTATDESRDRSSFAIAHILARWRFPLQLLLICVSAGFLSVMLGPDNYWDLRYYHLYAPWGYLHDRYLYDVGPAQEEGFLNPVADFLLYGLISSPLNETPRIVSFVMGAVHGINAALVFAIARHVIRPPDPAERSTLIAVAWLIGVSGGGFISLLGTSSNDLTSALFVLGSLLGVLNAADRTIGRGTWRVFAVAGLLAGLGIALKYTSAMLAPGLGIAAALAAWRQKTVGALIVFGVAATFGFIAVAAHHMLTLWNDFGNPVFPYMNQIFRSPYFEPTEIVEDRFLQRDLWSLITFPFSWTKLDAYVVIEPAFRDWRAAIAYVAMAAGVGAFAVRSLRNGNPRREVCAQTRGLDLVFIFVVVSYFVWARASGYYRYVIPLELLTGVATMGALICLVENRRVRLVVAFMVLAIAATTTVYPDWGRRQYGGRYVDLHVPPLPPNSVVLIATEEPVSYFIPFAEPKAQYVGIENNYLRLSQDNKLVSKVKEVMRTPGRPKFVLDVDGAKPDAVLRQLGLTLGASPCRPIRSNLEGYILSLCPLADD